MDTNQPPRFKVNPDPEPNAFPMVEDPEGMWVHLTDYRRLEQRARDLRKRAVRLELEAKAFEAWWEGRKD